MTNGVVYLNAGTGCCARLLVSIRTLRKVYQGRVHVHSFGEGWEIVEKIGKKYSLDYSLGTPFKTPPGKNQILLEKIGVAADMLPVFDNTLFIDADTVIMQPFDELFQEIQDHKFVVAQFSNWLVGQRILQRRFKTWDEATKDLKMDQPAINTGVFGYSFKLQSENWLHKWYELALANRDRFIADEVSLQMLLPTVPHKIISPNYNWSCKYARTPLSEAKIVHFHGRKHCRIGLPFHGDLWMKEYQAALNENDCEIKSWTPGNDRMLRRYTRKTPNLFKPALPVVAPPTPAKPDIKPPPEINTGDQRGLRHNRLHMKGHKPTNFDPPAPMLFSRDGHNIMLQGMYRGRACFLVCGGPSLKEMNLSLLNERGIITFALNNAASVVRPNLWTCVDDPKHFVDAIWRDPGILKLIPLDHMEKPFNVRNDKGELVESQEKTGDMPAVFGYRRNELFRPEQFFHENTVNWGNHSDWKDPDGHKGSRSVMLAALRLSHYLGIRRLFLLGCDFKMQMGQQNYAFNQDRTQSSVNNNNNTYAALNARFSRLLPYLKEEQFQIFNCTPNSGLTAFDYMPFEDAIELTCKDMPKKIITVGMYESTKKDKGKKEQNEKEQKEKEQKEKDQKK